jgi:probable F420-dependent oxidoreductase
VLEATEELVVATGIVSIWTESAATLAFNWHRVTREHPARFLLGLGVSHAQIVEQAGHPYERPYERMVTYLDALDQATPPVPKEDRVLAALGPRMLRLSAERSAGAHPYLVPVEHTRRARAILGPGPLLAPELMAVLDTDPGRAREIARATLSRYIRLPDGTVGRRLPNYTSNLLRLGYTEEDFVGGGSDRLVDAIVARGTVEDVEARVREHLDAGADHVAVQVLTAPDAAGPPLDQWRELASVLAR